MKYLTLGHVDAARSELEAVFRAMRARPSAESRADVIAAVRARAASKIAVGPGAARSQDFLYDDEGLPR